MSDTTRRHFLTSVGGVALGLTAIPPLVFAANNEWDVVPSVMHQEFGLDFSITGELLKDHEEFHRYSEMLRQAARYQLNRRLCAFSSPYKQVLMTFRGCA